jgi:hypothetical protein
MALDWVSVTAYCIECQHLFATVLPPTWDGSPIVCQYCGEISCEVSGGD